MCWSFRRFFESFTGNTCDDRFVYTGDCDLDEDSTFSETKVGDKRKEWTRSQEEKCDLWVQLLAVADRFQLPELVTLCAEKVSESITAERASEIIELAEHHNLPDLKV